jgi:pantoate--beta-alanine ligase
VADGNPVTAAADVATVRTVAELRARVAAWRAAGEKVALVPTMGALHEGHLSLVRLAKREASRVVATIFVNPRQFGPKEDFSSYPRTEETDRAKLAGEKVDLLFAPATEEMYPAGSATTVSVSGLGDRLEGEARPGFFSGVATIVTKLLLQAAPDVAIFGEKDYQQLLVIRRLVKDLDIPVRIVGGATVREADGLALSSRNAYLSAAERVKAVALSQALAAVAETVRGGGDANEALREAWQNLYQAGFAKIDYLEVRDAETLETFTRGRPARVLGAAWLGKTRLIDNVAV